MLQAQAGDPEVVKIGAGSYASFPPNAQGKVAEMLTRTIYVDPSMAGKPVPTNDWWTSLITERYSGTMWAYPLALRANETGLEVFYPTTWNPDGTKMDPSTPLKITGRVDPVKGDETVVVADFEQEKFADGWKTEGEAFGDGPSAGAVPGQTPVKKYGGERFANSHHGGDRSTGQLTSPPFLIAQKYLHFFIGGGKDENGLCLQLVIDNQVVRTATGEKSEELKPRRWDIAEFKGKEATLRVVDKATGGWGHVLIDDIVLSNAESSPRSDAGAFGPEDARALRWGDWTVTARLRQDDARIMDATFGRGLPFVWIECKGVDPRIRAAADATFLDAKGQEITLPVTSNCLVIRQENRSFALFADAGSTFDLDGQMIRVRSREGRAPAWLIVGAVPEGSAAAALEKYAYAIPRNSQYNWTYDPTAGEVNTTWSVETEALAGTNRDVLQGWIPHHYRTTRQALPFSGVEYETVRGKLRCAPGQSFQIAWKFNGIPPMLPAPVASSGQVNAYQPERMKYYLEGYAEEHARKVGTDRYGGDTYWGGKHLLQYGLYAAIAQQIGDPAAEAEMKTALRDALTDWFTYTPGEKEHYFARYDRWKGLVGFKSSFGSEEFTDNHFHYGYFTLALALMATVDPQFLADFGPMGRLVAKQYANWDRHDADFPFLRTFDPWGGHSYAGGFSSAIGNNQESSSEAMQSWTGLFLLGMMLQDKEMTAAGAMGWAVEESAITEYWNDYYSWRKDHGPGNYPALWKHSIVGILGDQGMAYGTFFNGQPRFIYGIQWLPLSTGLYYLGRDPAFAQHQLDAMMADQVRVESDFTFTKLGADWGDVTLGYAQFFNPDWAAAEFDTRWAAEDPIAKSKNIAGLTYYFTHADRQLGPVAWDLHTDLPGSLVYRKPGAAKATVVAWNPAATPVTCKVYQGAKQVGEITVPSRILNSQALDVPAAVAASP